MTDKIDKLIDILVSNCDPKYSMEFFQNIACIADALKRIACVLEETRALEDLRERSR